MAYVDLADIFDPAPDASPPAEWGDQIRDNFESMPRGVLAYDEADADVDIPNNTETTIAEVTVEMVPGRMYEVKGSVNFSVTSTSTVPLVRLFDVGKSVRRRIFMGALPGANEITGAEVSWIVTASTAESRTFRLTAQNTNSVGTLTLRGGAADVNSSACFIVVKDIGPVPT